MSKTINIVSNRLLFSAVAVFAFNGVAMANETVDDKDVSVLSFEFNDCVMETIEKMYLFSFYFLTAPLFLANSIAPALDSIFLSYSSFTTILPLGNFMSIFLSVSSILEAR